MHVKFKPLYGVHGDGPLSYLLQIKDFTFLLDCGWTDPYNPSQLEPLLEEINTIDAVLISHPDAAHIGALPYLVGKAKLDAAIYTTGAIHKMGQMFLYSEYITHHAASEFNAFDLDDVDAAFNGITQLRYRQEVALTGAGVGISITPLPSGRLIGGTIWKITAGGEELVYAVDFNHRRERHLNGNTFESSFHRPSLLIADADAIGRLPADRDRSERILLDNCMATLRAEGNVLIPVDAAGRVLELLLVLELYWSEHHLPYTVALVGPMVHTTIEFARSQLEWMNENLVKSFGHSRDNPFALKKIKLCSTLGELKKLPAGPKVVLAVDASLSAGPARQLMVDWAQDPRNLVVVALEPAPGSLGAAMLAAAQERDRTAAGAGGGGAHVASQQVHYPLLQVALSKRVPLKGEELERYLEEQTRKQEEEVAAAEEAAAAAMLQDGDGDYYMLGGSTGGGVSGGSPRSVASAKSNASHATRANVASIGHAAQDAAGFGGGLGLQDGRGDSEIMDLSFNDLDEGAIHCFVEGFEPLEGAVTTMFPAEDEWEAVTYDEYGATINFDDFENTGGGEVGGGRLGQALASEAEAERGGGGGERGLGVEEEGVAAQEAPEPQIPTKIETQELNIALAARVLRVDFDGRSDGRSVQTMLAHIAPRTAMIVHGREEATTTLSNKLTLELEGLHTSVVAPVAGQEVEVELGSSFEIELSEKLMKATDVHAVGGYELAWINGTLGASEDAAAVAGPSGSNDGGDASKTTSGDAPADLPALLPRTKTAAGKGEDTGATYGGVFIGDVRLSELKKALTAAGIRAEFHAGSLYCLGQVVIRRRGEGGGLVLEGAMSEAYYKVRDVVYGQYHIC
jgi:cleavage and polyadenylation specificity factor subunit 2